MDQLIAEKLRGDSRVVEAKRLLMEACAAAQQEIKGIRPAKASLKASYDEWIRSAEELRGAPLFHPLIGSGIGRGALVELADGSHRFDLISGVGVHFGHSLPLLLSATIDAALDDIVMQGNLEQNREAITLMRLLAQHSQLDHCFLSTSGAMACENALKIAFQANYPRTRLLAFNGCFAGRTLALAQITDTAKYREGLPTPIFVDYLPFFSHERPEESLLEAMACLKEHLRRYPKQHAALMLELIQGEGGVYPGARSFFAPLMELCRAEGILIIADEVQSFGRTDHLFAYQHFALSELVDIATVGKLTQVCATLFRSKDKPRPGLLSQTFIASSASLHAALAILQSLIHDGYLGSDGKNMRLGALFQARLEALHRKMPDRIRGPFGIGTMVAFTPYDGSYERSVDFANRLFNAGVIGFIAGSHPTRIRFLLPAGGIREEDIDEVAEIIESLLCEDG